MNTKNDILETKKNIHRELNLKDLKKVDTFFPKKAKN